MKKRRRFSSAFKAKIAMEALTERMTIQDLARKHSLHPNQINTWKKHFKAHGARLFESSSKSKQEGIEDSKLYEKIGHLQVENDFLKNALSQ